MSRVINRLYSLGTSWVAWLTVSLISAGLVAAAVFFQLRRMQFPCELCIYTRVWLVAIAIVGILGLILRGNLWARRGLLLTQLLLTLGLASVVWQLAALEYGFAGAGSCSMFPNFPAWAPLDQWFPTLFQVQGPCAATPKVLGPLSMADGLIGICTGFTIAFLGALIGSFRSAAGRAPEAA